MRLFKWRSIPGWIFIFGGLWWDFFGVWARIEFICKKLWPPQNIMSMLSAILGSHWFPVFLMIVGLSWIWWTTRLNPIVKEKIAHLQNLYNDLDSIAKDRWNNYNYQLILPAIDLISQWKDKAKRTILNLMGEKELDSFNEKVKLVSMRNEYNANSIGYIEAFYNEKDVYLNYLKGRLDDIKQHPELY